MTSIKLTGDAELQAVFARLGRRAPALAGDALEQAAAPMEAHAEQLAPKRTRALADGIHTKKPVVTRTSASIVIQTGTREDMRIDPSDPYYYPAGVEYGTRHAPPQPFMRPAFDAGERRAQQAVADQLARTIPAEAS